MSLVSSLFSVNSISYGLTKLGFQTKPQMQHNRTSLRQPETTLVQFRRKTPSFISIPLLATKAIKSDFSEVSSIDGEDIAIDFDFLDEEDEGSPWEGAIVYKRNASILHLEYCTTLERLGLGKISSQLSKIRASEMGLRVTKDVKEFIDGTPVLVSIDVTRKKHKLRLDGIIRTVISLACNRCGEPAAKSVFSNFSLLLTEEPVEEPEVINMGIIYGEDKSKTTRTSNDEDDDDDDDDDDAMIDMEDRLHFPPDEKEIDISKHIRDSVHLEITINAICDPKCKGLCLNCGTNLNINVCKCSIEGESSVGFGPLKDLRKQMQKK